MKIKRLAAICAAVVLSLTGIFTVPCDVSAEDSEIVKIDPDNASPINDGNFEGWGTSLCWYGNRIGGSEKTTAEAAKYLYNADTGLGLNIIRYNVGGGDDPSHDHIRRSDSKMPGYWSNYNEQTGEFDYDFTQDENQRNVLLKSIEECPDMLVEMFSNSAPYFMTRSGCTSGTTDSIKSNLEIDKIDDFAEYMATVVKHYVDEGINVVSVEPMNEPSNGWNVGYYGVKQEGCSIEAGEEQSAMILAMDSAMEKHGLGDLILSGMDETSPGTTVSSLRKMSEEAFSKIERFNTHTYSTGLSDKLKKQAVESGKTLWMSETDNGGTKGKNSGEMGAALNFASQITNDLNDMQPSAWIMWQAIGSYCDVNNEYDPDTLSQHDVDTNGFWGVCFADMNTESVVLTKKYYGFGQYTRYIRPGDTLISTEDYYTTAAYNEQDEQLKIVAYNTSEADREVSYDLSSFAKTGTTADVIRTSGDMQTGENWAKLDSISVDNAKLNVTLKGNSITTFVVNGVSAKGIGDVNGDGEITTADVGLANAHAKGVKLLSGEKFDLADVNGDRKVSTADVGMINSHAKGVKKLW